MVFKTPWQGDPRVNIQNAKGKAKVYQVRQVLYRKDISFVLIDKPICIAFLFNSALKAISRLKDETN